MSHVGALRPRRRGGGSTPGHRPDPVRPGDTNSTESLQAQRCVAGSPRSLFGDAVQTNDMLVFLKRMTGILVV